MGGVEGNAVEAAGRAVNHWRPYGVEQEAHEPQEQGKGLLARLAQLPDPRSRHGRRYRLAALGIRKRVWEARYQAPGETALRRLLQRLDVEAVDALVGGWLAEQLPEGDRAAVAVDGKTLRGARGADGQRPHLLAALLHRHGVVEPQRQGDHTRHEIGG